jgi:mannose-6-phosphate isomerase-like protein (cupin superfamily)
MEDSMEFSRREMCLLLPALAASSGFAAEDASLPSKAYPVEELTVRSSGENKFRHIFGGQTHTGFSVELHESDLAPGSAPHPPHHHDHEEIFMMREGTLEVTIEGKSSLIGPGSAAYVASNQEHGVHNPGPGHAQYFVFALGTDKG